MRVPIGQAMAGRRYLFLQGLSTPLFFRLGRRLRAEGAVVHRINICAGDMLFWPSKATNFRDKFQHWSRFLVKFQGRHGITDIILAGDCRPYHRVAIARARARGITVHVFDEGVLRPNWITMESDPGWRAPRRLNAATLPRLARKLPEIGRHKAVGGGFAQRAWWDVGLHACNIVLGFTFPHYVRHRPQHPQHEGIGWIGRTLRKPRQRRASAQTLEALFASRARYFLLAFQLDSDAQIRFRSPFVDMGAVLETVLTSFARKAKPGDALLVKSHPLDNGVINRRRQVEQAAERHGLTGRVHFIDSGHLPTIIDRSVGVVVVNSTVGLTALHQKRATFALAKPLYRLPGLTAGGTIDKFWIAPTEPRPGLMSHFERVLLDATQINGSYFNPEGIALAIEGIMKRLRPSNLP